MYKYLDLNSKNLIRSVSMFYWFHENEMIWHIGMTFKLPPHISSCSLYSRSSDRTIQGTCLKYWYDMTWKKTNKKKKVSLTTSAAMIWPWRDSSFRCSSKHSLAEYREHKNPTPAESYTLAFRQFKQWLSTAHVISRQQHLSFSFHCKRQ